MHTPADEHMYAAAHVIAYHSCPSIKQCQFMNQLKQINTSLGPGT